MTGQFMRQWIRDEAERVLNHEVPLARMAREAAEDFDRRAVDAVTGKLADLPQAWPGPELGAVSGDGLAGARAAGKFGHTDFDLWEQVRAPDRLHRQFQRYTDANGNPPGDCWRTALACLIQVQRDDVPHFVHEYDKTEWWKKSVEWVEQQRPGWTLENYVPTFPAYHDERAPSRVIVTGQSPRGDWLHSVICDAITGELVHDPHPSGDGVLDQQGMAALVTVT